MKVLLVMGTRPEVIKLAPVLSELQAKEEDVVLCTTGQHRELLDQALALFHLKPDYDLDLMQPSQSLATLTANAIRALDTIIVATEPDIVLVEGDTTTAMVAALAAFYRQTPVGHVEAGLRTSDVREPFPEELNRRIIALIADLHFAPTRKAEERLLFEGAKPGTIHMTGNPVVDALQELRPSLLPQPPSAEKWVLVTAHRRESIGKPLERICVAIREVAEARPDVRFIWPVHMNPRVQRLVNQHLEGVERVQLRRPLNYLELLSTLEACHLVVTDSGGLQEEAPSFNIPVLVVREKTERTEAVDTGAAKLVGTQRQDIVDNIHALLDDEELHKQMCAAPNPFGDGQAAKRIVKALRYWATRRGR